MRHIRLVAHVGVLAVDEQHAIETLRMHLDTHHRATGETIVEVEPAEYCTVLGAMCDNPECFGGCAKAAPQSARPSRGNTP